MGWFLDVWMQPPTTMMPTIALYTGPHWFELLYSAPALPWRSKSWQEERNAPGCKLYRVGTTCMQCRRMHHIGFWLDITNSYDTQMIFKTPPRKQKHAIPTSISEWHIHFDRKCNWSLYKMSATAMVYSKKFIWYPLILKGRFYICNMLYIYICDILFSQK